MITAIDLTKLGKYAEAVRKFTERVPKLPEVLTVKVNPTSSIEVYQRMS